VSSEISSEVSLGVLLEVVLEVVLEMFLEVFLRVLLRGGILIRRTCCPVFRKEVMSVFRYRDSMFGVGQTAFDKWFQ
jgi:hypothetical protein